MLKDLNPKRGDYVAIQNFRTGYGTYPHIIKRLMGQVGDVVSQHSEGVYLNETYIGPTQKETSKGEILTPLASQTIPKGFIFVATEHLDSFDSRYAEFGLVSVSSLYGKAIGLL